MIDRGPLIDLAERASDPFERLAPPFVIEPAADREEAIDRRLTRWAELGGMGDLDRLRRSLAWRGIDLDALRPALGRARLADDAALPAWAERFAALLVEAREEIAAYVRGERPASPRFIRPERPYPFEMVLAPLVLATSRHLHRDRGAGVAVSALAAFEAGLLSRLARLCRPVLADAWAQDARLFPLGTEEGGRMREFAARLWAAPLPRIFVDYPVLARLITLACDNWIAGTEEALGRVQQDRPAIAATFNDGADPGDLVEIDIGDSDVHDAHRQVLILTFARGLKVVYKPRSMALDAAFARLVATLNHAGLSHELKTPTVLACDGYGYAEHIEQRLCADEPALARFYHRMGALAALTSALGSTDLHYSNVIASGDMPVPIDLETLLSTELRPTIGLEAWPAGEREAYGWEHRRPDRTMLLPRWQTIAGGQLVDRSAIGFSARPAADTESLTSLPCPAEAQVQVLARHRDAIIAGFEEMCRLLVAERPSIMAPDGPLAAFDQGAIRVVLRDTWLYLAILRHSIEPAALRDGADRAIALERLNHIAAVADEPPPVAPIIARERAALLGLDVPRFSFAANGVDLLDFMGTVVEGAAEESPLAGARSRIVALNEEEIAGQVMLVRGALLARLATDPASTARRPEGQGRVLPPRPALIEQASAIACRWLSDTRVASDGARTWQALAFDPDMKRWLWQPGGDGLARGRLGLAVFFGALFRVTGLERWRREAMNLACPALARAAQAGGISGRPHQPWCGLETGVGGFFLAAAILAESIGRQAIPSGLVDAAVATVPPPDSRREIGGGVAGLRIGLLALGEVSDDPRLADAAARCASDFDGVEQAGAATRERFDSLPVLHSAASAVAGERGGADQLASAGLAGIDSFRFGTAGEVDALLWLSVTLGRADLAAAASRRAAAAIARAESCGWRWLPGIDEAVSMPGLFDGLAGIAYMLLRLADPAGVPSLWGLILERSEVRA